MCSARPTCGAEASDDGPKAEDELPETASECEARTVLGPLCDGAGRSSFRPTNHSWAPTALCARLGPFFKGHANEESMLPAADDIFLISLWPEEVFLVLLTIGASTSAIICATSGGMTSSLNCLFTTSVTAVVRMLLIIQYTANPEGTLRLKNAMTKGKLFTNDCDICSCSVSILVGSLGAAITRDEND